MSLSRKESHRQKRKEGRRRGKQFVLKAILGVVFVALALGITLSLPVDGQWPQWVPFVNKEGGGQASVVDKGATPRPSADLSAKPTDGQGEASGTDGGNDNSPGGEFTEETENGPGVAGEEATGEEALPQGDFISLSFVGDLLPAEYLLPLMKREGYDYPYRQSLLYLSEPDLTAGNLELPVTLRGTPLEGTPFVYKGTPDALPALKDAGFDVVSLANNHAMDQGVEGLRDTRAYLDEAGIGYMGAGDNDTEAFAPYIVEAKGIKVAYIGVSKVIPFVGLKADRYVAGIAETYDTTRAIAAIEKAKEQADLVVVMAHWGKDAADTPEPYQRQFAQQYIDAGADLVIGSHPHVLQGFEQYKGKWIAYSLGNFIFTVYPEGAYAETGVLDAMCSKSGECSLTFNPMKVVAGQPTPLEGEAAEALLDRLTSISFDARLDSRGRLSSGM